MMMIIIIIMIIIIKILIMIIIEFSFGSAFSIEIFKSALKALTEILVEL